MSLVDYHWVKKKFLRPFVLGNCVCNHFFNIFPFLARCACGLENLGQGDIRINLKTFNFFIFSFTFWPFSMIFFQSGSYKMCC